MDERLAAFDTPTPIKTSTLEARQWRDKCRAYADRVGLPKNLATHFVNAAASKVRIAAAANTFKRGCHLTGAPLQDKVKRGEAAQPFSAVVRSDDTMVCMAMWELSQHGAISDAVLINTARAITQHTQGETDGGYTQPSSSPEHTGWIPDQHSEPDGHRNSTGSGEGQGTYVWSEELNRVVRVAD